MSVRPTLRRLLDLLETADSRLRGAITAAYAGATGCWDRPGQLPHAGQDPRLKQLLEAHYRAHGLTGLASLLDVFLCAALAFGAATLAGVPLGISYRDGTFGFLFLAAWTLAYLVVVYGSLRLHAATPGMRLLGIVAVSSRTGRPAAPHEVRLPTKWDYRRDRPPRLLFVPRQDLGLWE